MATNIVLVEDAEGLRMVRGRPSSKGRLWGRLRLRRSERIPEGDFPSLRLNDSRCTLPSHNGLELCRDIRLAGIGIPVLMLSARCETADVRAGFDAGANDYLTKPFDILTLAERVDTL